MFFEAIFLATLIHLSPEVHCGESKDILYQKKFPPCKACKILVDSFKKGIDLTAKGKFEGGDTAWEEQKLGSYANSEIRLTEIQENICTEIIEGRDQCYAIHEEHDSVIEEWWFKKQKVEPDLFKYFCIDSLQYCCPEKHYGPECLPCDGYPDNICSNNGKCKGAGTRKGNGKCHCDVGYTSDKCDQCAVGYFESSKDEKKLICSKCHSSCDGPCKEAGAKGCTKCKDGWIMDDNKGCQDIDECALSKSTCGNEEFCVNNEGSYRCVKCDKSCSSCAGAGPDKCKECAEGYIMKDGICKDAEQESRQKHMNIIRYLFYLGLSVATYIVFQKSTVLAALIGIAVAVYIFSSEYFQNITSPDDVTQYVMSTTSR